MVSPALFIPQWTVPFMATFVVSILPVGMLLAMPTISKIITRFLKSEKTVRKSARIGAQAGGSLPLNSIMCFAAGSLLADAMNHLTEEARQSKGEPCSVAIQALAGILAFFIIDRFTRLVHRHEHGKDGRQASSSSLSVGYLSLVADAVHNFTDGLAIAASFSKSFPSGISTTTAIFMHEIPHELGDYALLAKSGFSHAKIIQLQLVTAGAAFAGTAVGVAIESGLFLGTSSSEKTSWLLPVTCGGFLYLGLCTIMSEVLGDEGRNRKVKHVIMDVLFMVAGIGILQLLETHFGAQHYST